MGSIITITLRSRQDTGGIEVSIKTGVIAGFDNHLECPVVKQPPAAHCAATFFS